jgi:anti-anti-sigma factor
MVAPLVTQQAFAMNMQLTHGRHGAAARVELHERPGGRLAALSLRGWVDLSAERRIEQTLDDLAARGATHLLVDCSLLRHVDYRLVPRFVAALSRFEARSGSVALCGLSRYLRDLFRLSGCDEPLQHWPSAAEVLGVALAQGHLGERAS